MGLFSRFEDKAEDLIEGSGRGGIEPVKIAKKAAKEMQREKMIGVGHEYAPTLFNVLVSIDDDRRMGGYYPSLAGEIETFLQSKATEYHLLFDCPPLVRFIVDEGLKRGKFDVIAENVSPAIIEELRQEEMEHYGLDNSRIEVNPAMRHSTSPANSNDRAEEEFDPFIPADMQHAHYIPEDAPIHEHKPDPIPAAEPVPVAAPAPQQVSYAAPAPQSEAPAAETVLLRQATVPAGTRVCLYNYELNKRYPLDGLRLTLGRGVDNDIVVNDPGASRHHAELAFDGDVWMVLDRNSTNGTFLNGEPVTKHILIDRDVIEVGTTRLEFQED